MAARDPLWLGTGYTYTPEEDRTLLSALLLGPRATYTPSSTLGSRPGHGICRSSDLLVTEDGTPGMRVKVAAGTCFIAGSSAAEQGSYVCRNDGNVVINLAAADATNRRNDIIVAKITDADYVGGTRTFSLVVVQGADYAGAHNNANDPALPASSLALARVQVAPAATTIVNANITDLRLMVPLGRRRVGTAAARALAINVEAGEVWFETDTLRTYVYDGSAWKFQSHTGGEDLVRVLNNPGGNSDSTGAAFATWGGTNNITVPPWATSAFVTAHWTAFPVTADGADIRVRMAIGTDYSNEIKISGIESASNPRRTWSMSGKITITGTGTKAFVLQAYRNSGSGGYRMDASCEASLTAQFK